MADNFNRAPEEKLPSDFEVFLQDLPSIRVTAKNALDNLVGFFFTTEANGGMWRRWILLILFGSIWGQMAFNNTPVILTGNLFYDLLVYPWEALLAANTMRHVILMGLIFWLALRQAAIYLDDVFELKDVDIAERYLMQAVFANEYNSISIRDGGIVPEHHNSPLARIGGPGKVRIHYDNVVLFEKADGMSNVLGPDHSQKEVLDRYERIREVIDLRDKVADISVRARTKDGIHVEAKGAQVVYSIARGNKEARLENPHPYDKKAVEKIVYDERNVRTFKTKQDRTSPSVTTDVRSQEVAMRALIIDRFRRFINDNILSEFLTQVQEPEMEEKVREKQRIRQEAQKLATGPVLIENEFSNGDQRPPKGKFFARDQITQKLFDEINQDAMGRGMQLHWIDIGTWVLPEEAKKIQEQHLEAWNISVENIQKSNPMMLEKLRKMSAKEETIHLMRDTPLKPYFQFNQLRDEDAEQLIRKMLQAYWERMRAVYHFHRNRREEIPEEISLVTNFLGKITPHKLK